MDKHYTFTVTLNENGELHFDAENTGRFSGWEILGFLLWKQRDIEQQLRGEIDPTIITRTIVHEEEQP